MINTPSITTCDQPGHIRAGTILSAPISNMAFESRHAIRLPVVMQITGLKRSSVYGLMNPKSPSFDPKFPRSFHLGDTTRSPVVWWAHEIVAWLEYRAAASRFPILRKGAKAVSCHD